MQHLSVGTEDREALDDVITHGVSEVASTRHARQVLGVAWACCGLVGQHGVRFRTVDVETRVESEGSEHIEHRPGGVPVERCVVEPKTGGKIDPNGAIEQDRWRSPTLG